MTILYTEKTILEIVEGLAAGLEATAKVVGEQADEATDLGQGILLDGTSKGIDMSALIIRKSIPVVLTRLAELDAEERKNGASEDV